MSEAMGWALRTGWGEKTGGLAGIARGKKLFQPVKSTPQSLL